MLPAHLWPFAALWFLALMASPAKSQPLAEPTIRQAMHQAETLMLERGIDVKGYAQTAAPVTERVPPSHLYLQGNDGSFVDGRIYLNASAISGCQSLNLLHEIVHDATVKFRLFKRVSNGAVRGLIEALADQIAGAAALDPYRPGCLPRRRFEISTAELASLAGP